MPQFRIPGPLRTLSGGSATVDVQASDLRGAIDELDRLHPGFKGRLLDDSGQPRQFVNLFVNDEDVRLGKGLDAEVTDGDEIAIVPAVAGGCRAANLSASSPALPAGSPPARAGRR